MIYDRIEIYASPVPKDLSFGAKPGELLPDSCLIFDIGEVGEEENPSDTFYD